MANPGELHAWIAALPENGRYAFSRAEAESVTDASKTGVAATLRRMRKRNVLVSPRRGFHVVIPPEYRTAGCPPATWFIDDLMRHLGRRYYVSLLSAAALHGAGHQQPMAFQVISGAPERDIEVGRVRIEFHVSRLVSDAATVEMPTETGTMVVGTPETTALDMVRFPAACGYWSNIATALSELVERLDPTRLAAGAERVGRSDAQRLGWLLDSLGATELADSLAETLTGKRLVSTPLNTAREASAAPLDPRWRVLVNDNMETDL